MILIHLLNNKIYLTKKKQINLILIIVIYSGDMSKVNMMIMMIILIQKDSWMIYKIYINKIMKYTVSTHLVLIINIIYYMTLMPLSKLKKIFLIKYTLLLIILINLPIKDHLILFCNPIHILFLKLIILDQNPLKKKEMKNLNNFDYYTYIYNSYILKNFTKF